MEKLQEQKLQMKVPKILTSLILLLSITFSCKSKRYREIEKHLTNGSHKYWSLDSNSSPREVCYYKNKTFKRVYYNKKTNAKHMSGNPYGNDVKIGPNIWGILDDSTLIFHGHIPCRIILLNDSTFVYINLKTKDTLIEYRSKYQNIPITNKTP